MTDNRPVIFYTRDDCGSFHTAKTRSRPRSCRPAAGRLRNRAHYQYPVVRGPSL